MSEIGDINRRIKSAAKHVIEGRKGATQTVIELMCDRMKLLKAREFKEQHRNDDAGKDLGGA